jgi:tRNA(Ile)-lysidine synthase
MIAKETLETLQNGKNLLAFSAGVDSTALFFLLCDANISFDLAIVNYGLRVAAKEEVAYAKELAKKYNKKIYTATAPKFSNNFEANARNFRYNFFEQLIKEHNYTNLITAHQLNDNLEWLLMRLSQGSGVEGLSGMNFVEQRENYTIVRPLLHQSKEELLEYLEENRFTYFIDQSNFENRYLRNQFRPLVNDLLAKGKSGYIKSLQILQSEKENLLNNFQTIHKIEELNVFFIFIF